MRAIALIIPAALVGCHHAPESVRSIATEIRGSIPAGWHASVSNNTIRIRSDYDVWLIGRISRPTQDVKELIRDGYGYKTKYEVLLTFVPLLSTNALLQLKAKRAPFLDHLEGRRYLDEAELDGKAARGSAMRGYTTNLVPTFFTSNYSIFVERPIDRFVETYPSNAVAQADAMLVSFRRLFHQYEN